MRKVIAIILLVAAAAGLVYGVLGVTQKTVKVKSGNTEGVYSFVDNSFDGTMAWSSGGGISAGFDEIKKLAHSQRSRQMWIGSGDPFLFEGKVKNSKLYALSRPVRLRDTF